MSPPRQEQVVFAGVSTGGFHTCGVDTAGGAWCWGYNGSGQLGDGSTQNSGVPVKMMLSSL